MTHTDAKEKVLQVMCNAASKAGCKVEISEINDAMRIACKALDKMIPKECKKEKQNNGKYLYFCETCGGCTGYLDKECLSVSNFCEICGQALNFDWSDDDAENTK